MTRDGGNGDGNGDGNGAAGDAKQQLTDAQAKLTAAEGENKTLKDAKIDLEQRLEVADTELLSDAYLDFKDKKGKSAPAEGDGDGSSAGGLDLDRASNRELVDFVEKKHKGNLDAALKDIKKELDLGKEQIGMIAAQFDVALASLRHDGRDGKPTFGENQEAIFKIAKANPKWTAEQCYRQFLLQSKADTDAKAAADKKKADDDNKAATEKGDGVPSSASQGKQLSKEEAGDAAYRKAFGGNE